MKFAQTLRHVITACAAAGLVSAAAACQWVTITQRAATFVRAFADGDRG
jgi:hypothetical protein